MPASRIEGLTAIKQLNVEEIPHIMKPLASTQKDMPQTSGCLDSGVELFVWRCVLERILLYSPFADCGTSRKVTVFSS